MWTLVRAYGILNKAGPCQTFNLLVLAAGLLVTHLGW